ncbi:MAG: hypothetical protein WC843_05900 [Candidatus Gracilibacteria bacterium]|jgi:hypothetical protein
MYTLDGAPPPHYLNAETLTIEDTQDGGLRASGEVRFPSTDPTIGERGHVNMAHTLFAVWNVAHALKIFKKPLALESNCKVHKMMRPDTEYSLTACLVGEPEQFDERRDIQKVNATISDRVGTVMAEIDAKFCYLRNSQPTDQSKD